MAETAYQVAGAQQPPPRRPERCNSWCDYSEGGACRFCGWPKDEPPPSGLRIYDIEIDDWRPATQLDLDMLGEVARAYGELRRQVEVTHANLQTRLRTMRSKAGAAHEGGNGG